MKRLLFIIGIMGCATAMYAQKIQLNSSQREKMIERVKEYCNLMQIFSSDMEQVEKMEDIIALCENNKVQTFDDLSGNYKSQSEEYNSQPLFQYLQNITTKYDNSLQVTYSDFKCEKVVSEPAISEQIAGNAYALVHTVKKIKGKGINATVPLCITINISSMKIGGTISEDYEDPYSLYLKGVDFLGAGKHAEAIECLQKCMKYKTYSGRYRAMTVLGDIYNMQKEWVKAIEILKQASEQDPCGGIRLALLYISSETPFDLQDSREALRLLEKYSSIRDKEFPEFQILAKMALSGIYLQGILFPEDLDKAGNYLMEAYEAITDYQNIDRKSTLLYAIISMQIGIALSENDYERAIRLCQTLETLFDSILPGQKEIAKMFVYNTLADIYHEIKNDTKCEEYINKLKALGLPKTYNNIANLYQKREQYDEAVTYYKLAADNGNGNAAFIMSNYYMPIKYISDNALDGWGKYLFAQRNDKNEKTSFNYAKISAEAGDLNGAYRVACFYLNIQGLNAVPLNYEEALKWVCSIADREAYNKTYYWGLLAPIYEQLDSGNKQLLDYLLQLADSNSPFANYAAYQFYGNWDSQKDTLKAFEYLKRSAELEFYNACTDIIYYYNNGVWTEKNYQAAYRIARKLADKNIPEGIAILGECEATLNKDYKKEKELYLKAFEMKCALAAYCLGELYYEGKHDTEKDFEKAKWYFEQTISFAKSEELGSQYIPLAEEYLAKIEKETASEDISLPYMSKLQRIADNSLSPEERIMESEELLTEIFDSPNAIIKIVGSNGTTIVATETASDFLTRLSTSSGKLKLVKVNSQTNESGKLKELTIKEEREP